MNIVRNNIKKTAISGPKLTSPELIWKFMCGTVSIPLGMTTVPANNVSIIMRNGKFDGFREPGIRFSPLGKERYDCFLGDRNKVQKDMYITDYRGNPIIGRTSVTYRVINPLNHIINIEHSEEPKSEEKFSKKFILDPSNVIGRYFESQVRNALSKFTYDELLKDSKNIFEEFTESTNKLSKMEEYGIEIQRADLLDIKYAPEIAKSMLIKQQVQATIDARRDMIDNVVEITNEINGKMGNELTPEDRSKLATYLTLSMLTDKSPQMTYEI